MRELITGALRLINVVQVNETPSAADMDISLSAFNGMLDSWSAERLGIFSISPYFFHTTGGKQTYTLGTGGDWDIERPMQIQQATYTINGDPTSTTEMTYGRQTLDLPMELLNDAQYSAVRMKGIESTYPTKLYDDGKNPLRTIYLWPVPQTDGIITLWLWQPLATKATLDVQLSLPKGYERALRFGLAVELSAEFGKELTDRIVQTARDAKGVLKRLNSGPQVMVNDLALAQPGTAVYNNLLAVSTGA